MQEKSEKDSNAKMKLNQKSSFLIKKRNERTKATTSASDLITEQNFMDRCTV